MKLILNTLLVFVVSSVSFLSLGTLRAHRCDPSALSNSYVKGDLGSHNCREKSSAFWTLAFILTTK